MGIELLDNRPSCVLIRIWFFISECVAIAWKSEYYKSSCALDFQVLHRHTNTVYISIRIHKPDRCARKSLWRNVSLPPRHFAEINFRLCCGIHYLGRCKIFLRILFFTELFWGECSWHSARGGRIFKDCRRIRYEYFVRGLYLRSKNYLGLEARVVGLFRNSARDHHPVRASPGLLEIAGTLHRGCGGEVAAQFSVALPKLRIDTERTKNELYRNRPPPNRPNCAKKKTNEIVFPYIIWSHHQFFSLSLSSFWCCYTRSR